MRLLCIHHEPTSDGGTLLEPARAGGWAIEHWRANAGEPRPILDGVDAVIAYGGTMNPDDDERLAWIADVRATLADAVERDLPLLARLPRGAAAQPGARRRRAAAGAAGAGLVPRRA